MTTTTAAVNIPFARILGADGSYILRYISEPGELPRIVATRRARMLYAVCCQGKTLDSLRVLMCGALTVRQLARLRAASPARRAALAALIRERRPDHIPPPEPPTLPPWAPRRPEP